MFKETAEQITLHGLGFLQIKLKGGMRLHVWHPDLPKRSCFEHSNIHDHRFGFVSKVLVGRQANQYYRMVPNRGTGLSEPTHGAYLHEGERSKFGNRPWVLDYTCRLEEAGETQFISAGEQYEVSPYILHSTSPSTPVVVTLMTKTSEHKQGAHSFCRLGVQPDVDFDRKQWSEDRLWGVVTDAFKWGK